MISVFIWVTCKVSRQSFLPNFAVLYWRDLLFVTSDHIITMQQTLHFFDTMLSHDHPAYLGVLRLAYEAAKIGNDKAIVRLNIILVMFLPVNIYCGELIFDLNSWYLHTDALSSFVNRSFRNQRLRSAQQTRWRWKTGITLGIWHYSSRSVLRDGLGNLLCVLGDSRYSKSLWTKRRCESTLGRTSFEQSTIFSFTSEGLISSVEVFCF